MSWAVVGAAAISAVGAGVSANQNKKAAEAAAKGAQVQPWGRTQGWLDSLLGGAYDEFKRGNFNFGPAPEAYNAFLDFGGQLGIDLPGSMRIDPNMKQQYGPGAYDYMLNTLMGPHAWAGKSQTNPSALMGQPNPWMSGLNAGLGTYLALGDGATDPGVQDPGMMLGPGNSWFPM